MTKTPKPTEPQARAIRALIAKGPMGGARLGQAMLEGTNHRLDGRSAQGLGRLGGRMATTLMAKGWAVKCGGDGYRDEVKVTQAGIAAITP